MPTWKRCYVLFTVEDTNDEQFVELIETLGEIEETDPDIRDVDLSANAWRASVDMDVDIENKPKHLDYAVAVVEETRKALSMRNMHAIGTESIDDMIVWMGEGEPSGN